MLHCAARCHPPSVYCTATADYCACCKGAEVGGKQVPHSATLCLQRVCQGHATQSRGFNGRPHTPDAQQPPSDCARGRISRRSSRICTSVRGRSYCFVSMQHMFKCERSTSQTVVGWRGEASMCSTNAQLASPFHRIHFRPSLQQSFCHIQMSFGCRLVQCSVPAPVGQRNDGLGGAAKGRLGAEFKRSILKVGYCQ